MIETKICTTLTRKPAPPALPHLSEHSDQSLMRHSYVTWLLVAAAVAVSGSPCFCHLACGECGESASCVASTALPIVGSIVVVVVMVLIWSVASGSCHSLPSVLLLVKLLLSFVSSAAVSDDEANASDVVRVSKSLVSICGRNGSSCSKFSKSMPNCRPLSSSM